VDRVDNEPRGRLRALIEWLKGAQPPRPHVASARHTAPARLGHYRITGKLGEGGMGIVYSARDERLGRTVALKTMSSVAGDESARKRLWREARAAASVSHPNICQIYEIGEADGNSSRQYDRESSNIVQDGEPFPVQVSGEGDKLAAPRVNHECFCGDLTPYRGL
jgi:serine/threonine protein kinase